MIPGQLSGIRNKTETGKSTFWMNLNVFLLFAEKKAGMSQKTYGSERSIK